MKAAVLYAKGDLRVEDRAMPRLAAHHLLVRVKAAGICGSDVPRVLGDAAHHYPIVLGHEFSGVVERIGAKVTKAAVGDRVACIPLMPCNECRDCRSGNFAQCPNYSFIGSRTDGGWAEYAVVPESNAIAFDDGIGFEEAALIEPSAVALHALRHIRFQGGEDVAILGGGNIGLLTLQWARLLGARTVTVFDIDPQRLETAERLGADYTIDSGRPDARERWKRITGGAGFGVVMETAGADATMRLSFDLAAPKARVCFVGTPVRDITFPFKQFELMNRKEFSLTGSWMSYGAPFPGAEWELTLHFLRAGQLNFKAMIFRTFPLADIGSAFDLYRKPGGVKGKVLLLPS